MRKGDKKCLTCRVPLQPTAAGSICLCCSEDFKPSGDTDLELPAVPQPLTSRSARSSDSPVLAAKKPTEEGQLYLLVTDQGFLTEEKVVWESLHNVDGDGNFCDSEFHLRPPSDPETVYRGLQDQIDQDYLMALSLQQEQQSQDIDWEQIPEGISDLELAKKLQEEEDRRASQYYQEQEQAVAAAAQVQKVQGAASPASGRQSGSNERKRKEPREKEREKEKEKNSCVIL
nr:ubiquitin carboxyl-terminal hydrolase MINDY-2 [Chelonoidis abingdonii]